MRRKASLDVVFFFGVICLLYWVLTFINAVVYSRTDWLLWYSSVGLGLTGIALFSRNSFFITTLFCALFVIESLWSIGFLSLLIFNTSLYGLVEYAFTPDFSKKDFYMGLYHLIIPVALLIGIQKIKVHRYGWIGATVYTAILAVVTYIFSDPGYNVNCMYSLQTCGTYLAPLDAVASPLKQSIGLLLMAGFIFIPTNFFLLRKKR